MRPSAASLLCAGMLGMLLTGCSTSDTASPPRTVTMQIGRERFTLEVADTDQLRETGLMNRKSMPQDHGMLFVFSHRQFLHFWMRNTLIPLDILYVDASGRVGSIRQMKPLDETVIESSDPMLYAIELNQGAAQRAGVKEGDVLQIPAEYLPKKTD